MDVRRTLLFQRAAGSVLSILGLAQGACSNAVTDPGEDDPRPTAPPTCEELSTASVATVSVAIGSTASGSGGAGAGDGGGGVGGAGTGSAGGQGGAVPAPVLGFVACNDPAPRTLGCLETGVDRCQNGVLHRRAPVECPVWQRTEACSAADQNDEGGCSKDADCPGVAACNRPSDSLSDGCECSGGCRSDADCGDGNLCLCGEPMGQCVPAGCRSDADCESGALCTSIGTSCGGTSFACQSPTDQCATAADCPDDGRMQFTCAIDDAGVRVCVEQCYATGRPIRIDGVAMLAPSEARSDWAQAPALAPAWCSREQAPQARRWERVAAAEHASVAAFARVAMELLALGAPADLVIGAQRAMADEIEHARLAYGLASAFAARPIGPGPLAIPAHGGVVDLATFAVEALLEGCVGEGAAAIDAALEATTEVDPAVSSVLERIAVDEQRHAELGWRCVQWALGRDRAAVDAALREAASTWRPCGDLRDEVWQDLVAPTLRLLLDGPSVGATRRDPLAAAEARTL